MFKSRVSTQDVVYFNQYRRELEQAEHEKIERMMDEADAEFEEAIKRRTKNIKGRSQGRSSHVNVKSRHNPIKKPKWRHE